MATSNNIIPTHLIAVPDYPGYFFDREKREMYSLKVTGTLTRLKYQLGRQVGYNYYPAGFQLSKGGRQRRITLAYLMKLEQKEYCVPLIVNE